MFKNIMHLFCSLSMYNSLQKEVSRYLFIELREKLYRMISHKTLQERNIFCWKHFLDDHCSNVNIWICPKLDKKYQDDCFNSSTKN